MSPTARGLGPQLGGWAICYATIVAGFLYFEPTQRTHQLMSKINAFLMIIWWQVVWYLAMLPNKGTIHKPCGQFFGHINPLPLRGSFYYIAYVLE